MPSEFPTKLMLFRESSSFLNAFELLSSWPPQFVNNVTEMLHIYISAVSVAFQTEAISQ